MELKQNIEIEDKIKEKLLKIAIKNYQDINKVYESLVQCSMTEDKSFVVAMYTYAQSALVEAQRLNKVKYELLHDIKI